MAQGTLHYYLPSEEGTVDSRGVAYIRLEVSETWDDVENNSSITVKMQVKMKNFKFSSMYLHGILSAIPNGGTEQDILSSGSVSCVENWSYVYSGTTTVWSKTITIAHSADGTGNVKFKFKKDPSAGWNNFTIAKDYQGATYYMYLTNGTIWEKALYTIPRKSSLSVSNGTLGQAQSLTIERASASFTHTISYECGSASGTVEVTGSDTVIAFTPPLSLAAQNTTGATVNITYTLSTINGSTVIGTEQATASYAIPESVKPAVTTGWAAVTFYNEGTGAAAIEAFVQGYSKAKATFDSAKVSLENCQGATIASYKFQIAASAVTEAPYISQILTASGTFDVECYVYDTRGRYAKETLQITILPYANPTLGDISVFRCDSYGVAADNGTSVSVKANATISSLNGLNTLQLRARYKQKAGSYGNYTQLSNNTASVIGNGLISVTASYIVQIIAVDSLGNTAVFEWLVPTETLAFHLMRNGTGAAFGKYAEIQKRLQLPGDWLYRVGDDDISDFVCERGTSGIWAYRKWASGIAECWGIWTGTLTSYATLNGFYCFYTEVQFVTGLFIETPTVNYCGGVGSAFSLPGHVPQELSAASMNCYLAAAAGGEQNARLHIHAIGKWK